MGDFDDLILNDGSKPLDPSKNDYFLVTITDLLPGKTYPIEFRWNYDTKEKNPNWSSVVKVTTPAYAPDAVTSLNASWSNEIFTLSFTHDRTLPQNSNVIQYKVKIVAADSTERVFFYAPKTGSSQVFTLEYSKIVEAFGLPLYEFSGSVISVDKDGNESTAVTFPLTTAATSLPAPVITVSAAAAGYTVSYTTPSSTTYPNYHHINIEEVESAAGSDPAAGYSVIFSGVANPAIISRSNSSQRWVRARFYSKLGLPGPYSTAYSVSPTPAVVLDTTGPSAPSSGLNASAGVDNSGTIGFNGYIDLSWTAVSDSTLRGYRIRFRSAGSGSAYSYVDSPGTGTSYRLGGLAVGATYEIGIASYDEINNTSSAYQSFTNTAVGGTPFVGTNVNTTGYFSAGTSPNDFQFGYGIDPSNNSGTFSGTKRGIYLTSANYWVIDSSQSAKFKAGGPSSNYIQWDGTTFTIDGNIVARQGTFNGNVQISAGSLYAGSSPSSGARLAISSTGLTAYDSNGSATTNIYSNAAAGGVTFTTSAGTIGNWSITNSSITKTLNSGTLTLDSSAARITASGTTTGYIVGLAAPTNNQPGDIVLYAGSTTPGSAPFRVRADGAVTMTSATITGYATGTDLTNGLSTKIGAGDVNSNVTSISGGVITTGTINLNNVSINNSATGSRISLDSTGLKAYSGGTNTVAINSDGSASFTGSISGSTITGGTIQTATSGDRMVMDSTTINGLYLYSNASVPGQIRTFSGTGDGVLKISAPYNNVLNAVIMNMYSFSGNSYIDFQANLSSFTGSVGANSYYTGTADSAASAVSTGTYIGNSGFITARRDGSSITTSSVYFSHRYSDSGQTNPSFFRAIRDASTVGNLRYNTSTNTFETSTVSDYRLKENISNHNLFNSVSIIKNIPIKQFSFKSDLENKIVTGFIAHELQEVAPFAVSGEKDALDENGNPDYQEVGFSSLIPDTIAALQYSLNKIEELEQRLDALEG